MKKRKSLIRIFGMKAYSDKLITYAVLALMLFGSVMIMSTDLGIYAGDLASIQNAALKQVFFVFAGIFAMSSLSKVFTFARFDKLRTGFLILIMVLLAIPLFRGEEIGGSRAWITFGGVSVQPSEFAKPFLIMYTANAIYLSKKQHNMLKSWKSLFRATELVAGLYFVLILGQKDLGTASILFFIYIACLLIPDFPSLRIGQRNIKVILSLGVIAGVLLFGVTDIGTDIIAKTPFSHVSTRVKNMKNPYEDVYGEGYQPSNALYGIASSNIFGKGLGESNRKYGYLTQAENDYILAIVIEELGVGGLLAIVILYGLIIGRLYYFAMKTNEQCYKVILGASGVYIFMHFFLNVGGVVSLIPSTGVPLLFISAGGSSIIAISATLGVCQSCIARIRAKEMK